MNTSPSTRPGTSAAPPRASGFSIVESLAALALLGLLAVAVVSMGHLGVRLRSEAAALDRARSAASNLGARLETISWHRLPAALGASERSRTASADTADGTAPEAWSELLDGLPGASARVELEGLAPGGARAPFEDAVALRLRIIVRYEVHGVTRQFELSEVRT